MGVYIKSMEMPKSCEDCHLESFCSLWVEARRICKWSPDNREAFIRHPNCPLVPVPTHGRLIDADDVYIALTEYYHHRTAFQHMALEEAIERVPTIISVSEESE